MEAFSPAVRELRPGERPSDWESEPGSSERDSRSSDSNLEAEPAPARESAEERESIRTTLAPMDVPLLYQMQFTTTEEHTELVEKARALLSHGSRKLSLGELHLQAMRLLVEALEKKRFGAKRSNARPASNEVRTKAPLQRGHRSIPAAVRRQVYDRDQGRCTFVDAHGERCAETHLIQMHHRVAFANGGEHTLSNLELRCAAHNTLAAEQDFGRAHIDAKRERGAS